MKVKQKVWRNGMVMVLSMAILVPLLTACTTNNSKELTGTATPTSVNNSGQPVTVDAMWMYDWYKEKEWGADPVTQKLTQETGVQFKFSGPGGDGDQKANVMLVSQKYPEVMWMDRGPTWQKYVQAQALYPIDELAKQYGYDKLIGEYIPQHVVDSLKHPDGHLYGIPNFFTDKGNSLSERTLLMRNDLYEKMGKPSIQTLPKFEAYLKQIRDANLELNGVKVYPLGLETHDTFFVHLSNMWGSQNKDYRYYDEKEGKVRYFMYNESTKEMLLWLNKMYREKLIDPENLTYKNDQIVEARNKGKWATSFANLSSFTNPNELLKKTDPNVYYKAFDVPAPKEGVHPYMAGYSTAGWNVAVITKNAKNPEALMKYFNYYLSPEGQTLSYYGIEGQTWEKVDGKPALKPGVYEEFSKDKEGYAKKTGINYLDLNQNESYNWIKQIESSDQQAERRIAENFGFDGTAVSVLSIDASTKEGIAWANIQSTMVSDITKMILAKSEAEVESFLNEFLAKYENMGVKDVESVWTKQYNAQLKISESIK